MEQTHPGDDSRSVLCWLLLDDVSNWHGMSTVRRETAASDMFIDKWNNVYCDSNSSSLGKDLLSKLRKIVK